MKLKREAKTLKTKAIASLKRALEAFNNHDDASPSITHGVSVMQYPASLETLKYSALPAAQGCAAKISGGKLLIL